MKTADEIIRAQRPLAADVIADNLGDVIKLRVHSVPLTKIAEYLSEKVGFTIHPGQIRKALTPGSVEQRLKEIEAEVTTARDYARRRRNLLASENLLDTAELASGQVQAAKTLPAATQVPAATTPSPATASPVPVAQVPAATPSPAADQARIDALRSGAVSGARMFQPGANGRDFDGELAAELEAKQRQPLFPRKPKEPPAAALESS